MTRVLRVLRRSMTPGHHVVVVIGLVTAKLVVVCAHCYTQQMLALSLYSPRLLFIRSLLPV